MIDLLVMHAAEFLLEGLTILLGMALFFRYMAYRNSRDDQVFFSSFTREIEKKMQEDSMDEVDVEYPEDYITNLINHIEKSLPPRSVRFGNKRDSRKLTLKEYTGGSKSLIHSLRDEVNVFSSHHPPNFRELTARIMNRDEHWVKLFGVFKIDSVSRMIDALPGLFIVIGIFGTFVGVSRALPQISQLDFNNLESSSGVLSAFVLDVTFAMKTSIAGIMCSFVLSVLNALSPIGLVRRSIAGQVETTLERLWFFVQGDPEQQKLTLFKQMVANQREISEGLGTNRELFRRIMDSSNGEPKQPRRKGKAA